MSSHSHQPGSPNPHNKPSHNNPHAKLEAQQHDLLRESLPDAIGGLISQAVLTAISFLFIDAKGWIIFLFVELFIWLVCLFIAFKRTTPVIHGGRGVWKYNHLRPWMLFGLVFIPSITALGLGSIRLWQYDVDLSTTLFLSLGAVCGCFGCFYFFIRRDVVYRGKFSNKTISHGSEFMLPTQSSQIANSIPRPKRPHYPLGLRLLAAISIIIILLVIVIDVGVYFWPTDKTIILISKLDNGTLPDPDDYSVNELIWRQITDATEKYNDVLVKSVDSPFKDKTEARTKGKNRQASIIIWGSYRVSNQAVLLSVHYEIICPLKCKPKLGDEVEGKPQSIDRDRLESFELQMKLSREMAYLTLVTTGLLRYERSDWSGAIERFDDSLAQISEDENLSALNPGMVYFYRALAHSQKKEYDRASSDYTQSLVFEPDNALAYNNRGNIYYNDDKFEDALKDYKRAAQLSPDSEIYSSIGDTYYSLKDYDNAIISYNTSIEINPRSFIAYYWRGRSYLQKNVYDLALDDLYSSINYDGDRDNYYKANDNVYEWIGYVYEAREDYDQAISNLDKAIERNGESHYAYYLKGVCYYKKGNYKEAISDFDKSIDIKSDYPASAYYRGMSYRAIGDIDNALEDFKKVIGMKDDSYAASARSEMETLDKK